MPSAGAARNSSAPFLSESSMGVIDDTGFSILSNTYGLPSRHSGLGSKVLGGGLSPGSYSFPGVLSDLSAMSQQSLSNFALANRNLPAIIWCFVNRTGWRVTRSEQAGLTFPCQQWDIAPSFSRLLRHFVAGNRSTECRGAVSIGASLLARGDASKILTVALRECLYRMSGNRVSGATGQTEKRWKNNS